MSYEFENLKFKDTSATHGSDAVQAWETMDNGYQVSIVKHKYSYGGEKGMYEIGVYFNNHMVDPADWGDTVKGWLRPSDVIKELDKIAAL